jgi:thiamine biosynthesis lipoprotein
MSLYNPQSEIIRFNNSNDSVKISKEFENVLLASKYFNNITNGAFDVSVGPLVKLWGFHNFNDNWVPPSHDRITEIRKNTGDSHWAINDGTLSKSIEKLHIDVNAIAKGFGVDQIVLFLLKSGFTQFLVEIGGEVYCHGLKQYNLPWKIGIELPGFENREIGSMVKLTNFAMATSGNYRNYYTYEGEIFSHTINPHDGYPVKHNLVSATVVAPTCLEADALATSLMVMGTEIALELINQLENVECLLIERLEDGTLNEIKSNGFNKFMEALVD